MWELKFKIDLHDIKLSSESIVYQSEVLEGVPEHQLKVRTSCCPGKKPFFENA